ncbi:P-loop containing nucleoside triphosphate hydrolase protein [Hygrophoropsis aurantiaca]|uniref:P-loop containing nucleoside triphosphate hydrolase protein n=1 Tax=Hygrophoropsis aurantiaca TaxID=72124 RepID=A0ACB8AH27_9AGAM|nr:P-loop containing nucleoside triphosphate hydrolase protein [Hygrophoropsis aurantiaca]
MSKVILVGVGGPTCSGKTTLSKHLRRILPNSVIIHQDDFAPPEDKLPLHPVHNVRDWDAAPGAIDWPRLTKFLKAVKQDGKIPPGHISHDHLNEQKDAPIPDDVFERLHAEFKHITEEKEKLGEKIIWGILDGFLLYWHQEVIDELDARIFLRVPHDVLKKRREERQIYFTAESASEGTMWKDPPQYWEHIVYPAYVDAHAPMFENGDVENGNYVDGTVRGLVVLDGNMTMEEMVERSCEVLKGM